MLEGKLHHASLLQPGGAAVRGQSAPNYWNCFLKCLTLSVILCIILKDIFYLFGLSDQVGAVGSALQPNDISMISMKFSE